uniref:Uncharacterized protein n=1 Tax=Anguilla anguilla TaxID=7936 RepID=A0A0E9P8V6_ANGAN
MWLCQRCFCTHQRQSKGCQTPHLFFPPRDKSPFLCGICLGTKQTNP